MKRKPNFSLVVGNVSSFVQVQDKINKVHKYVKKHSIEYWNSYKIQDYKLKKPLTGKQAEKKFNIFFCNGLSGKLESVRLCYWAYDGLLTIEPNPGIATDSVFNFNTEDDPHDNPIQHDKNIWKLWKDIKKQ